MIVQQADDAPVPRIWYSPSARKWWMDPATPLEAATWVCAHPDAIHVTNAYDCLAPAFLDELRRRRFAPEGP